MRLLPTTIITNHDSIHYHSVHGYYHRDGSKSDGGSGSGSFLGLRSLIAQRRSIQGMLLLLCAVSICISLMLLGSVDTTSYFERTQLLQAAIDVDQVPDCTFQDLLQFKKQTNTTTNTPKSTTENGWKLQEEIIRVPADAIFNREHLPTLGTCKGPAAGVLGSVHKAVIKLPSQKQQQRKHAFCKAVLKTDKCYSILPLEFTAEEVCDKSGKNCVCVSKTAHSCLDPKAGWNFVTNTRGEYLGALPWYAQVKTGNYQKGLLPTYAIVEAKDRPLRQWVPEFILRWFVSYWVPPHPDRSVMGILMPLLKFQDLESLFQKKIEKDPKELKQFTGLKIAKLMVSATEGLVYIHRMGLVYQDILPKNIGILWPKDNTTEPYSLLFDNLYMGTQKDFICPTTQTGVREDICNYRHEEAFPLAYRSPEGKHEAVANEAPAFRGSFQIILLDRNPDPKAKELRELLLQCNTSQELLDTLYRFIADNDNGNGG